MCGPGCQGLPVDIGSHSLLMPNPSPQATTWFFFDHAVTGGILKVNEPSGAEPAKYPTTLFLNTARLHAW